jgi:hypothetical protein
VSGPDTARRESWSSTVLERQVLVFHYRHAALHQEVAFPPQVIHKRAFREGLGVACLASTGARYTALYSFERHDIGYRFRRLHPEVSGKAACSALLATQATDLPALAELGLSLREIAAVSGVSLEQVRQRLSTA